MHKTNFLHGVATLTAFAALTFLLVVKLDVHFQPFRIELVRPESALGYSSSLTSLCSNLEAYWKFDESTGTPTADTTENNHDGTLTNMSDANRSSSYPSAVGFVNTGSLIFDGTDDYVSMTYDSALRITGDITIALWVNYDTLASASSGNVLLAHGGEGETSGNNVLYQLSIGSDKILHMYWETDNGTDTTVDSTAAATIAAGQWHHIAAVRDVSENTVLFYVSGALLGSSVSYSNDPTDGTSGSLYIGAARDGTPNYYDGKLDDVRIYTSVLTGAQILALAGGSDVFGGCSCGNGIVESPETCDNGGSNSDITRDACRTNCRIASCGDGLVDSAEACDNGSANSDTEADACRTTCAEASCGDGAIDTGEVCDDGNTVNTDACLNSCTPSVCGDQVVQDNEECDDGAANSDDESNACRTTCLLASCGDAVADLGETCDTGGETAACDSDCTVSACGDGLVNATAGEQCDDGESNSNSVADACRTNCKSAYCGDGVLDVGETCDDGNADSTDNCTALCALPRCGDGFVQQSNNETCEPPNTATCASNCQGVTGGGGGSSGRRRSTNGIITLSESGSEVVFEERDPPPEGCGNRVWEPEKGEECDEGIRNGVGACSYSCKTLYCGDGIVSPEVFEQCEPDPVSELDGIPQFEEPICGKSCSIPNINRKTGRVIGGCKLMFLESCPDEESSNGPAAPVCGNGVLEEGEECDDGNVANNDGCNAFCATEFCGDGVVQTSEQCDNGSVCSNNAQQSCRSSIECNAGLACKINESAVTTCGGTSDGALCESDFDCAFLEQCAYDTSADTTCNATCVFGEPVVVASASCGNSTVDEGEECDDGNALGGDGCSAFCVRETFCGNGTVDLGEACDDGNTEDGDGCSVLCTVEEIQQVTPVQESTPQPPAEEQAPPSPCGNGSVDEGEQCDVGDQNSDSEPNACRTDCTFARCGDGVVDFNESCDDGTRNSNTVADACRITCTRPFCGDGIVDSAEECDGGQNCQSDCRRVWITQSQCGNGIREQGEDCDDGNLQSGDGCTAQCREEPKIKGLAVCGNGLPEEGEKCDDANTKNGDGCSATCTPELTEVAGASLTLTEQKPAAPDEQEEPGETPPLTATLQALPDYAALQQQAMAAQQWQQQREAQTLAALTVHSTPVGDTGPASLLFMISGMAAGMGASRRRK